MAGVFVLVSAAEGVSAAVQSGADAVAARVGYAGREGLSYDELYGAARFCRVRGVTLWAELDALLTDAALPEAAAAGRMAWLAGCDGLVVSDPGLILALRRMVPEAPLMAGRLLRVQSLEDAETAAAMGLSLALLSPFLTKEDIHTLAEGAKPGLVLPVHGALSAAFPGLDLTRESALHTGVRDPRLLEAETAPRRPFALPELCLLPHMEALAGEKLRYFALDGVGRRPEYIAAMTWLYVRALAPGRKPDEGDLMELTRLEPVPGFTDAFFTGKRELEPAGRPDAWTEDSAALAELRRGYLRREYQRVPVRFLAEANLGAPLRLAALDDRGNRAVTEGGKTELAFHRELTATTLQTELYRTGGTPFLCEGLRCRIGKGIAVNLNEVGEARDKLLRELMERRAAPPERTAGEYAPPAPVPNPTDAPLLTVSVQRLEQLSPALMALSPPVVYVPLEALREGGAGLLPYLGQEGVRFTAVLPPAAPPSSLPALTAQLLAARQLGIETVEVSTLGQALFCRRLGFALRGGMGLGLRGSGALAALKAFGFASVTLAPVLSAEEVAALGKAVPAELVVYGRLPLLTCPAYRVPGGTAPFYESFASIPDDTGLTMPLTASPDSAVLWSAKKLYLGRRSRETMTSGLWGVRLMFTTEGPEECVRLAERFLGKGAYFPANYTTGAY